MLNNAGLSKEKSTFSFYMLWSVVGLMLFCVLFNVFREKGFCFSKFSYLDELYTE